VRPLPCKDKVTADHHAAILLQVPWLSTKRDVPYRLLETQVAVVHSPRVPMFPTTEEDKSETERKMWRNASKIL
jgi:hypothetical protein